MVGAGKSRLRVVHVGVSTRIDLHDVALCVMQADVQARTCLAMHSTMLMAGAEIIVQMSSRVASMQD